MVAPVAPVVAERRLLDQADRVDRERGEGGVRTAEPGAQHDRRGLREGVVEDGAGEDPQQPRPGDVDDEDAPGKPHARAPLHRPVEQVAGGGPERAGRHEPGHHGRAHVAWVAGAPASPTSAGSGRPSGPPIVVRRASAMPAHAAASPTSTLGSGWGPAGAPGPPWTGGWIPPTRGETLGRARGTRVAGRAWAGGSGEW